MDAFPKELSLLNYTLKVKCRHLFYSLLVFIIDFYIHQIPLVKDF